jgi:hypothetical protein
VVTSFSYLFREQPSPPEAYYGAWFYIPAGLQIRSWLSLHHFGYHRSAGGGSNDIAPAPAAVYVDDATISLARVGIGG